MLHDNDESSLQWQSSFLSLEERTLIEKILHTHMILMWIRIVTHMNAVMHKYDSA